MAIEIIVFLDLREIIVHNILIFLAIMNEPENFDKNFEFFVDQKFHFFTDYSQRFRLEF